MSMNHARIHETSHIIFNKSTAIFFCFFSANAIRYGWNDTDQANRKTQAKKIENNCCSFLLFRFSSTRHMTSTKEDSKKNSLKFNRNCLNLVKQKSDQKEYENRDGKKKLSSSNARPMTIVFILWYEHLTPNTYKIAFPSYLK